MNYFPKILIVLLLLSIHSSAIFAQKGGALAVEYKKKLTVDGPGEWINQRESFRFAGDHGARHQYEQRPADEMDA